MDRLSRQQGRGKGPKVAFGGFFCSLWEESSDEKFICIIFLESPTRKSEVVGKNFPVQKLSAYFWTRAQPEKEVPANFLAKKFWRKSYRDTFGSEPNQKSPRRPL